MYNLQQLKMQLEQQLAQVNGMISQPALQPAPAQNIEAMIATAVQKQIAAIAPPVTIMAAIGGHLGIEDQRWVSANLNNFSQFLQTQDGREVVMLALDGFKNFCGVNNESSTKSG